jgi:hypothetical protein
MRFVKITLGKSHVIPKMFIKPHTHEDLQIQMRILKGNHLMLKTSFQRVVFLFGRNKQENYWRLYRVVPVITGVANGNAESQLAAVRL